MQIYLMETVVPGLIKIGKTASDQFEDRMYDLERNGYHNIDTYVEKCDKLSAFK